MKRQKKAHKKTVVKICSILFVSLVVLCASSRLNCSKFVCIGAKTLYFPICGQKWKIVHLHSFRVVGPNLNENVFFCWGHLGLVVSLFFSGSPHLALNLPYFCCFVFVCFVCVFFVWFVFSFGFENNFQCLPFFLLSLPVSLSLLLFSFFFPSFLSFFLPCFLFIAFLFWGLSFLPCVSAFVS